MDKSWIRINNRLDPNYVRGVTEFMIRANEHKDRDGRVSCPCVRCFNARRHVPDTVRNHILDYGFDRGYVVWWNHGESTVPASTPVAREEVFVGDEGDNVEEMLNNAFGDGGNFEAGSSRGNNPDVDKLFADMETPLFPGCENFSKLTFLLKLMHVKVTGKVTNSAMDSFLQLLADAFFKDGSFPKSHYEAKKYLRTLGLGYESIQACKYDCALFWKENESLQHCPVCGESRWAQTTKKGKKIPHKVLRYFPVTSRLKRIYSCRKSARLMQWHDKGRSKEVGVMRHPADAKAWHHLDGLYPDFAADSRNVRLGLASDGFNPFGNMSLSHSTWPVVLIPYNMPPQMCMDDKNFMMTLLIPGPSSPGKDIDVYLRPLIEELHELWTNGAPVYDSHSKEMFTMRAVLLWTVNDFSAYGYLSGWSTGGYKACPTCNDDTISVRLREKIGFIGHRRLLPGDHPWRRSREFNGKQEFREPPTPVTGDDCLRQLNRVPPIVYGKHKDHGGKKRKRDPRELNWSRRSIFFDLPYWHKLLIRHNIDVMHVEKNFTENLLSTIFDVKGKTKDTKEAREDLRDMKIRKELHLVEQNGRTYKPQASYVLSKTERKQFCAFMRTLRFPDGFAGNLARNANIDEGKIQGFKSHDCHVFVQRVLPIGCRPFFTKQIRDIFVELGQFFRLLTARTLRLSELEQYQDKIALLVCKLERVFPAAFFTVMVHLLVHLPFEAILGGPVQLRWMYPIERYIGRLKKFVRNKARPEGSIAEGYVVEEALNFCTQYLNGVESKFAKVPQVTERKFDLEIFQPCGRPLKGVRFTTLADSLLKKAEWFVLNNCPEVEPYVTEHKEFLRQQNIHANLDKVQGETFATWFRLKIGALYATRSAEVSDELYALSCGPDRRVRTYTGYIVNGVKFLTKEVDDRRQTQNCGVSVPGTHGGIESEYNGVLDQVVELDYVKGCRVVLFVCTWFDSDRRRRHVVYEPHHTIVDTSWEMYKEDPFVFPDQVRQVFYVQDPTRPNSSWKFVERFTHRHTLDIPLDDASDYVDIIEGPGPTLTIDVPDVDNLNFLRHGGDLEEVDRRNVVNNNQDFEDLNDEVSSDENESSPDDYESSSGKHESSSDDSDESGDDFE